MQQQIPSKAFIIAGIKNLLKRNYGVDPDTVDLESYVDSQLSFGENWTIIKEMLQTKTLVFDFMRCHSCSRSIRDDWAYCPSCGNNLNKEVLC